jgi:hypothetical protein
MIADRIPGLKEDGVTVLPKKFTKGTDGYYADGIGLEATGHLSVGLDDDPA